MNIRPIDQVGMVNKTQEVSGKKQSEISKTEMIAETTYTAMEKKAMQDQKKVNDTEKTEKNKIDKNQEEGKEGFQEEKDRDKKREEQREEERIAEPHKGGNLDLRI